MRLTKAEQARLDNALDVLALASKVDESVRVIAARSWQRLRKEDLQELRDIQIAISKIRATVAESDPVVKRNIRQRKGKSNADNTNGA